MFNTMEPNIDLVSCLDQFVGQARAAAGTKSNSIIAECREDALVPPAWMAKFHHVTPGRIQLRDDPVKPRSGIMETGRELEEKATHPGTEKIGNKSEVADEGASAGETFDVGDELRNFDGVDKPSSPDLSHPTLDGGGSRPGIEGRIELDRLELRSVVSEPFGGRHSLRIKTATPVPVEPPRTADVDLRRA